jgi:hypothetical protein
MAAQLRSALERYSREELVDLMTHLLRVYVLEQAPVIAPELEKPQLSDELEKFTFPQLLIHLQMSLELAELSRFRVAEGKVFVTVGDNEFQLDGPSPILPPEPAEVLMSEPPPPPPSSGQVVDSMPSEPPKLGPRSLEAMRQGQDRSSAASNEPRSRFDSIFGGGGGGESSRPNIPMVPDELLAPDAPPPIADKAPGDVVPETKRDEADVEPTPAAAKAREEAPPPPPPGDKKPTPSNRFAALEFD